MPTTRRRDSSPARHPGCRHGRAPRQPAPGPRGQHAHHLLAYCADKDILVEAYSPIAHGEILHNADVRAMADAYGVTVPQLCIRYTLQLGTVSLPKTANPDHMRSNAEVDFTISDEDMATLRDLRAVDYGASSAFPVYSGR